MDTHLFLSAGEFRNWLLENAQNGKGIWLVFGKAGGPETISPNEALEEALCFGWVDSQIRSMSDKTYIKYFSKRRKGSEWSEKNKKLVDKLTNMGRMTTSGLEAVRQAMQDGTFKPKARRPITQEDIDALTEKLRGTEPAFTNFSAMPPSVKRTYTALFHEGKSEETRQRTFEKIVDRLKKNLKPM